MTLRIYMALSLSFFIYTVYSSRNIWAFHLPFVLGQIVIIGYCHYNYYSYCYHSSFDGKCPTIFSQENCGGTFCPTDSAQ